MYNLSLPRQSLGTNGSTLNGPSTFRSPSNSESTTKTYDEIKDCEASEYISLGLNSTPSNSRSSSPSNSLDTDINDWSKSNDNFNGKIQKKHQINHAFYLLASRFYVQN